MATMMSHNQFISSAFLLLIAVLFPVSSRVYPPSSPPSFHVHDESFKPDHILRVTAVRYPMDCTVRYSTVINGTIPGPELRFREGDLVWIRVYNDMDSENTTVHWHGLTQRTSPFSDGTPLASQWPIPPHHYFDYEFQVQPGDAGTYYYHVHVGFGAGTAFGPLIVEERRPEKPPFDYDDERTLMFSDVFHINDSDMIEGLLRNPFHWGGETLNVALNGRSRTENATRASMNASCSYGVITVQPNKTYRIRLIGAMSLSQVFFAFENHSDLTLIEVDGRYISPVKVSHIQIHTAMRYSVLLRTKSADELRKDHGLGKNQYWIQMETRSRALITTSYAVLAYQTDTNHRPDLFTKPLKKPLKLPDETLVDGWMEDDLKPHPLRPYDDTFPETSEVTRRVFVNITQVTNGSLYWLQDGLPWYEDSAKVPYLVSVYKKLDSHFPDYKAALANGGFDRRTRTFPAKIGEVLEIVWQNIVGNVETKVLENHPVHVHGDHIWDVGTGGGEFSVEKLDAVLSRRRANGGPIQRDTTNLYRDRIGKTTAKNLAVVSWRVWRVRVQSPGVWMMHCHILQHMIMGMSTVWVFGEASDLKPLAKNFANSYLEYGGSAYGNGSFSPSVVHYWHY